MWRARGEERRGEEGKTRECGRDELGTNERELAVSMSTGGAFRWHFCKRFIGPMECHSRRFWAPCVTSQSRHTLCFRRNFNRIYRYPTHDLAPAGNPTLIPPIILPSKSIKNTPPLPFFCIPHFRTWKICLKLGPVERLLCARRVETLTLQTAANVVFLRLKPFPSSSSLELTQQNPVKLCWPHLHMSIYSPK